MFAGPNWSVNGKVMVVGAGLAGSEVAWSLANAGVEVHLYECKRKNPNPAQRLSTFGELVCSNSLKSQESNSAHGILKFEMRDLGSIVWKVAQNSQVPAGSALAVDRQQFSAEITQLLSQHPKIKIFEEEITSLDLPLTSAVSDYDFVVVASGPLTSSSLENYIKTKLLDSPEDFYFYDAIAPVVDGESLNWDKLYYKDRYKSSAECSDLSQIGYLNAPFTKEEYDRFVLELVSAQKLPTRDFEDYKFFEGCLPIDTIAERGAEAPRFSCMKPVGLEFENGERPHAVVQLRKENLLGTAFNLVGFQTRLTHKEQLRVFRMIPGFENARFIHLGSVHRNSFLNAKGLLNYDLSFKKNDRLYFAGQLVGVEGYTESASAGIYVAYQILRRLSNKERINWPLDCAIGALINYVMTAPKPRPSNINYALFPPVVLDRQQRRRKDQQSIKRDLIFKRARKSFVKFMESYN
ncbi:MAG: methylenetetrahydrofolate--tRNA-(uracil(54)-C(5))-methyltransferase (FADH(2)-oxidizing) TrmFO [Bdellovibrionales bacterium RIFOXYD12_FULL_39_22]|nr:MAG: methylenetetrahydrofolate--tRNA-(uracil(54)-C(5))-methyltransferase (FADH(2)-oxidizing) TrmFO [Bdellovibrionales bacterium RIFOXYB1_FULL_39_21]OFZ41057.1 MAG: methylenetetrahydrofolate--tRNA-(uracil(54)-C(5))-methyltransferase (FADH(2)-oxidizing) TrmFO [Bdellovibrionales bacterium RIFOXYC12_FULL_39_17]OFZ50270.1 MAG: methylenetetrahydrofolate--tRNA-(uracil(54)-C(5))-methyltransferase (FADH(2)-oxidizing) TrmFO [Bdellovibrionales bacterium RIFOXYC1_FULL_39_130]OFZ73344.1 MAG: methylenetetr